MSREPSKTFLSLFMAMLLTQAALIWSIPPLFRSPEPTQVWTTGILGALAVVLFFVVHSLRPQRPRRADAG